MEFSTKISLSALCSRHLLIGRSFPGNALYALHTMLILSSCGIFVYKLIMNQGLCFLEPSFSLRY